MRKPNMIVIYCDDLGYGDLGCYGSDTVKTPHLDRLAEGGVRFTEWYSNSPVCSPSRASLLTGRYPARTGVEQILGGKRGTAGLAPEQVTIAKRLKQAGYRTALYGKWHLGMAPETSPNAHGFDEFFGFKAGCIDYYSHIFYWGQDNKINPAHDLWQNQEEVWCNGEYMTELITKHAVEFIDREDEEPFFLYLAYNAPHYPMHAPAQYMERYAHLPWDRQMMAAMISAVDDGVGDIVSALQQAGLFEDTLIFFSSDNGPSVETRNWLDGTEDLYYGGSAGIFRGHKGSLFEGGIREPAILSYPARIASGQVRNEPCLMMDMAPTLLELVALPAPREEMDGRSILKLLNGTEGAPHPQLFWQYNGQLAVREGHWKLVLNGRLDFGRPVADLVHLSNLEDDPGERINLKDQYPEVVERLSRSIREWQAENLTV
ncbi:sulfatase-like hydrolase/transferase [Paenibacillus cremeus]|uniref:Sulfatase-like hydrolase/transferase n=1 Tax=Paenibacillus cremeus TaxID=2163881 RepID=A0A559KIQ6_9BACL|nr:sulfatase-like hydrolase/transferase [Paenibacillus cremeus]TVY12014.1 sulfatase-like hydrolase/transferase [Paenibacillus cremeus]